MNNRAQPFRKLFFSGEFVDAFSGDGSESFLIPVNVPKDREEFQRRLLGISATLDNMETKFKDLKHGREIWSLLDQYYLVRAAKCLRVQEDGNFEVLSADEFDPLVGGPQMESTELFKKLQIVAETRRLSDIVCGALTNSALFDWLFKPKQRTSTVFDTPPGPAGFPELGDEVGEVLMTILLQFLLFVMTLAAAKTMKERLGALNFFRPDAQVVADFAIQEPNVRAPAQLTLHQNIAQVRAERALREALRTDRTVGRVAVAAILIALAGAYAKTTDPMFWASMITLGSTSAGATVQNFPNLAAAINGFIPTFLAMAMEDDLRKTQAESINEDVLKGMALRVQVKRLKGADKVPYLYWYGQRTLPEPINGQSAGMEELTGFDGKPFLTGDMVFENGEFVFRFRVVNSGVSPVSTTVKLEDGKYPTMSLPSGWDTNWASRVIEEPILEPIPGSEAGTNLTQVRLRTRYAITPARVDAKFLTEDKRWSLLDYAASASGIADYKQPGFTATRNMVALLRSMANSGLAELSTNNATFTIQVTALMNHHSSSLDVQQFMSGSSGGTTTAVYEMRLPFNGFAYRSESRHHPFFDLWNRIAMLQETGSRPWELEEIQRKLDGQTGVTIEYIQGYIRWIHWKTQHMLVVWWLVGEKAAAIPGMLGQFIAPVFASFDAMVRPVLPLLWHSQIVVVDQAWKLLEPTLRLAWLQYLIAHVQGFDGLNVPGLPGLRNQLTAGDIRNNPLRTRIFEILSMDATAMVLATGLILGGTTNLSLAAVLANAAVISMGKVGGLYTLDAITGGRMVQTDNEARVRNIQFAAAGAAGGRWLVDTAVGAVAGDWYVELLDMQKRASTAAVESQGMVAAVMALSTLLVMVGFRERDRGRVLTSVLRHVYSYMRWPTLAAADVGMGGVRYNVGEEDDEAVLYVADSDDEEE